jgi:hypothetical protein
LIRPARRAAATERIHLRLRHLEDGDVLLALERQWSDGTTHLRFSAVELLERLAVLIPRPRINFILYRGILGPRAAWPFDPAQGYPKRRRGMAVAYRRLRKARGDRRDDRRWRRPLTKGTPEPGGRDVWRVSFTTPAHEGRRDAGGVLRYPLPGSTCPPCA